MKQIRIAFYIKSKTTFGGLIRTKQRYLDWFEWRYAQISHTEIDFGGNEFFSSSEVDGWVRFKYIDAKDWHWIFSKLIKISNADYQKLYDFALSKVSNKYNFTGIFFAMLLNFNKTRVWDYFCSQIVTRAGQEIDLFAPLCSLFTTPAMLAEYVDKKYWLEV